VREVSTTAEDHPELARRYLGRSVIHRQRVAVGLLQAFRKDLDLSRLGDKAMIGIQGCAVLGKARRSVSAVLLQVFERRLER
jgi:hypothetical protein